VLKEFLQDGEIPTADELTEAYTEYVKSHPDMSKPFILDEDHTVEENSNSSASAYNRFFTRAKSDLEAIYKEIWDRTADSMDSFDSWRIKLERLKKRLLDLESRIDALLLLRADTAGYFTFVEDNFIDYSKVDQDNTTAQVDVINHAVTIGDNISDRDVVNLNTIDLGSATFTVLTRDQILASREAPGSEVRYAVQDADRSWQHIVRSLLGNIRMSGEFKIKLGDSPVEISRIEMGVHASNTNASMIIVGMYSLDNYNWYNFPTDNYVQSVDDRALFVFPKTSMLWVKFIMTKTGADDVDDDQYIYEFGMSSLKFYTTGGYDTETGTSFCSKELSALDSDSNKIEFNKVTLQACQEVPDETSIQYWVVAKNDTEETEELRIDPYNINNPVAPTFLDLGKTAPTEQSNLQILPKDTDTSNRFFGAYNDAIEADRLALIAPSALSGGLGYLDESNPNPEYGPSTNPLEISAADTANMVEDQIIFYRNVGRYQGVKLERYRNVRDVPRGWKYSDISETYIQTTIVVNNPDGLNVDLGNQPALLDGLQLGPGTDNIPYGTHIFKTLTKNTWALPEITEDIIGYDAWADGYETKADLDTVLGTSKVNHKLLIEGVKYNSSYPVEDRKYLGVDVYCECEAKRINIFDLLYNLTDNDQYKYYSTDTTAAGNRVFVVRFDPIDYNILYPNEFFLIKYTIGDNMFDTIILKAELSSTASTNDKTPILTAYRLKLGA